VAVVPAAEAHPLGNFTINRYAEIDLSGRNMYVSYVLDMAEIPTFEARQRGVDPAAYTRAIDSGLHLLVNGRPAALRPLAHALAFPMGVGGLHTMRLEIVFAGPTLTGAPRIELRDDNYAGRLGWQEMTEHADHGATVAASSVPAHSVSDALRAYPKDMLQSPLHVAAAAVDARPGTAPGVPPALLSGAALQAPDRVADSGFTRLISQRDLSPLVILAALVAALFWGMAHALSPGHGKTIVAAYLVGQRGKPRHAALLGLIVTATHTAGVFALGAVTLTLSQFIVPDHLYAWINLAAGVLVVAIGGAVLLSRWRHRRAHAHGEHHHHHHHGHSHAPSGPGLRGLVAVGVSGGLLPCPSALVVLLAAVSLHRVAFGMVLILAFSTGLALSITGIGLLAVLAKRSFSRVSFEGPLVRLLPVASALVIVVAGLAMTARALPGVTL
jgi:ABC-type nickel/cobalt efflux system permease component RcnA